ncbi:MAG: hypothetical protein AAFU79_16500 [Myxococcota bacterium]
MMNKDRFGSILNSGAPRLGRAPLVGLLWALSASVGCGDGASDAPYTAEFDIRAEGLERTNDIRLAATGQESLGMSQALGLSESASLQLRERAQVDPSYHQWLVAPGPDEDGASERGGNRRPLERGFRARLASSPEVRLRYYFPRGPSQRRLPGMDGGQLVE